MSAPATAARPPGPPASERNAVGTRRLRSSRARLDLELIKRYQAGDAAAGEELVERMMPLVRQLARRYRGGEQFEDLVQVASVGLVKAIDRFDADRGLPFLRYAVPTMLGEIKRYFRDTGWAAHVPRGMQERVLDVKAAMDELGDRLGRSPTPAHVARFLGLPVEAVLETMEAATAYGSLSLDAPVRSQGDDDARSIADRLGEDDAGYELVEDVAAVAPAIQLLPERERLIMHLRFNEDLTQTEIAERIGISQMHVSRLLRRALERVRTLADNERVRSQPR